MLSSEVDAGLLRELGKGKGVRGAAHAGSEDDEGWFREWDDGMGYEVIQVHNYGGMAPCFNDI